MGAMPKPRNSTLTLAHIHVAGGASFKTARERTQARSLIHRLALSAGLPCTDLALSAVQLETLTGGRSEARVFKLTRFFGPALRVQGAPVVVKISPRAAGTREKANYEKFVREALPPACRPDLLGFCCSRDYAALCYSHAAPHGASRIETLTQCLQRGDTAAVGRVLRMLFDPLCDSWYSPSQLHAQSDIAQRYLKRYFTRPRATLETEARLGACAARYFKAQLKDGRYVAGGVSFPSPRATLFDMGIKHPYHSCILHGDLNSDNIIIAGRPASVAIVDFQKTGRGHVYEDLLHLEASVRINHSNHGQDASFAEILETERLIACGRRLPGDPYAMMIHKIRAAAARYFGHLEDPANYHYATAAIGLRLMQATDLTRVARSRITASALWAAKALAGEISR
jgi:hypothetical protein